MALLLSLPARKPTIHRTAQAAAVSAEIIILPCIRRERIDVEPAGFRPLTAAQASQRKA